MDNLINKISDFLWPPLNLNEKEQLIFDIFSLLLKHPDTECITAPISAIYYISNEKLQYWIKVWDEGVTLTNHKFSFTHDTRNHRFQKIIISMVQDFMEADRAEFERTVFQNEVEMLKEIKQNIYYS